MTEDKRKRNTQWCAGQIDKLWASLHGSGTSVSASDAFVPKADEEYPDFKAWQAKAMLDLLHSSGSDAISWKRLHVATSTLASAWAGLMLSRGNTYEDVKKFMDWSNEKTEYVLGFQNYISAFKRSRVVGATGIPDPRNEVPELSEGAAESRNLYAEMQKTGLISVPDDGE